MSKEYTPMVVAKSFTKQYYEIIHKKPQQLYRFYKDESNFFHGDESQGTETISGSDNIREKVEQLNLTGAVVDLTDGSIDAQGSVNNAVFLVVTGKFTMPGKSARPFVQSFFLECQTGGKGDLSYYVRNSVFRIYGDDSVTEVPVPAPVVVTTAVFEKKEDKKTVVVVEKEPVKEEPIAVVEEPQQVSSEEDDKVKGEIVEEASSANDDLDVVTVTSEPDYVNVTVKKEEVSSSVELVEPVLAVEEKQPVVEAEKPAANVKFSWAQLASRTTPAASEPEPRPKQQKAAPVTAPVEKAAAPVAAKPAGNPPLTVYISQLPSNIVEAELRELFEPFGNIKKVDVHAHKGFAFVDFSDAVAVQNAVQKKGTGYFTIRDTQFQIEERQTKEKGPMGPKNGNNNRNGANRQNKGQNDKNGSKVENKGGNNSNRNNNRNNGNKGGNTKQSNNAAK